MIELSVIGQEGLASLRTADYAVTLPVPALLALALPCLAAFLARSACAVVIAVLLAVAALSIPYAAPGERYQYSTLALIVLTSFNAAFLGPAAPRWVAHPRSHDGARRGSDGDQRPRRATAAGAVCELRPSTRSADPETVRSCVAAQRGRRRPPARRAANFARPTGPKPCCRTRRAREGHRKA